MFIFRHPMTDSEQITIFVVKYIKKKWKDNAK